MHPCERKYYYQLVTRMKQFLSHGDCHASQSNGPSHSLTVVQHDKGMTIHGLQVNQHNRPAYPVNSAQEAMLRREK